MADAAGLELKTFKSNVGMKVGMKLKPRVQAAKLENWFGEHLQIQKQKNKILRENGGFF